MPELTVAVPFYRQREYLRDAVGSVFAQADPRWRLVVSDGGGTSAGFVRELLGADPRCRVLPSDRPLGMADNWSRCLEAADTPLVTLLHEDDWLRPGYVGAMLAAADSYPNAIAFFCEAAVIGPDGRRRFSLPDFVKRFYRPEYGRVVRVSGERGLRAVMRGNFVMCPTLCFRRGRLGVRRFEPRWRQVLDLDLIARLLLAGEELVGLPDVLYDYRRHADNATAVQTESLLRFEEERDLFGEVAAAAEQVGWRSAARTARRRTVIRLNLLVRIAQAVAARRWASARRAFAFLGTLPGGGG